MARPTSKRPALLLTALALSAIFAGLPAVAHGPDTAGWIEQAGNGSGDSKPVIANLSIGTVLFSANRFTVNHPVAGPLPRGFAKYMAWGTRPNGTGAQVFVTGSSSGLTWDTPRPARIQDPNGVSIPFVIDQVGVPVVAATNFYDAPFVIFYRALGESATSAAAIHRAYSTDGIEWNTDVPLADGATPIVGGTGFKSSIISPADVIYNPSGLNVNADCAAAATPYSCAYTLLYTTADPAGNRYTSIARMSGQVTVPAGTAQVNGAAAPVLSPGTAGAWDDAAAENISIEKRPDGTFRALYSGKRATGAASLGWATSPDGVTWTKSASNPTTPASMFSAATPAGGSLTKGQFLADGSAHHQRAYITRTLSASSADLFTGWTAPAPGTAPDIRVASPEIGAVLGPKVPISIYVGDTLGATPGLNLQTLTVTIDGVGGLGLTSEDTIVGQFKLVGKKISGLASLADGPHTLVASVADLDGEITTVTVNFTVDGLAPNSTITLAPTGTEIGLVDSPGKFAATVIDPAGGTGIDYVTAQVTNPLGQIKRYTTHAPYGWLVTKVNASHWNVVWTAPTLDPHYAVPGDYLVSILGTDKAGNVEKADTANSAQVFVL